jgi:hypothetical protein
MAVARRLLGVVWALIAQSCGVRGWRTRFSQTPDGPVRSDGDQRAAFRTVSTTIKSLRQWWVQ